MITKHQKITFFSILSGIILAFIVNAKIQSVIIPDPCYYHTHEPTKMFSLFYSLSPVEGFHPFPTMLNFVLTSLTGISIGLVVSIYARRRRDRKVNI